MSPRPPVSVGRPVLAMPSADDCVLRNLLERHARERPEAVLAAFASGAPDWTYGEALADVRRLAAVLAGLGVRQGDHVAVWLPNGRAALEAWFAINYLGCVYVPLNVAYRGRILEHALQLSDARVMVVHPDLADRLADVDTGPLQVLVTDGEVATPLRTVRPDDHSLVQDGGACLDQVAPIQPWDLQAIIFTSGTTGPSKGVKVAYAQTYSSACAHPFPLDPADRGLVHAPLFHVSGIGPVVRGLVAGGGAAIVETFRTATFWADVRRTGATYASLMGSMAAFLLTADPSEDERASGLKTLLLSPLNEETRKVAERAGCAYYTVFSMSEVSVPILTAPGEPKAGICGRPRPGVQARVVDAHDVEVPRGQAGELVLRSDVPWSLTSGYHKDPAATAAAWRNGWFHTGDAFRIDADGDYVFIDRLKDSIRRRGENISSYEVEAEALAHPAVADCAAVAVPSEMGDDEVLLAVEAKPGASVVEAELFEFLRPRLPHFMLPRYIRLLPSLPRTLTQKVQKAVLREAGVTDAWDREAAGIRVTRETLSPRTPLSPRTQGAA